MALELQIESGAAKEAIDKVTKSIDLLEQRLNSLPASAAGLDSVTASAQQAAAAASQLDKAQPKGLTASLRELINIDTSGFKARLSELGNATWARSLSVGAQLASASLTGLRTAFSVVAGAARLFLPLLGVGAIGAFVASIALGSESVRKMGSAFVDGFSNRAAPAIEKFNLIIERSGAIEWFGRLGESAGRAAGVLADILGRAIAAISGTSKVVDDSRPKVERWSQAFDAASGKINVLTGETNRAAGTASNAASKFDAWAAGIDHVTTSARRALVAVSELTSASVSARAVSSSSEFDIGAELSANSYGGGNSEDLFNSFSGGGLSSRGSPRKARLPMSAFIGAPHFAEGGTTGSGIPAVLHKNEAVIPLTGGGAVPVSMGQGSFGMLAQKVQEQTRVVRMIDQHVLEHRQSTINNTSILRTGLDNIQTVLNRLHGTMADALVKVVSGIKDVVDSVSRMSVGGIAASAAASTPSATPVVPQPSAAAGGGGHRVDPRREPAKFVYVGPGWAWVGPDDPRYAMGSPNASKDRLSNGAFAAVLHPDEAIIPLPDGRSVPVSLPEDRTRDRFSAINAPQPRDLGGSRRQQDSIADSGTEAGAQPININQTFNITTADAQSFRKSRNVLLAEQFAAMETAMRRVGRRATIQDPTRKIGGE